VLDRGYAYFLELLTGEVRRIPLLGTSVNKGKKKGRGCYAPALTVHRVHHGAGCFMERIQPPAAASFSKNSPTFSSELSGWVSMRT
jgi:hypothetical protein